MWFRRKSISLYFLVYDIFFSIKKLSIKYSKIIIIFKINKFVKYAIYFKLKKNLKYIFYISIEKIQHMYVYYIYISFVGRICYICDTIMSAWGPWRGIIFESEGRALKSTKTHVLTGPKMKARLPILSWCALPTTSLQTLSIPDLQFLVSPLGHSSTFPWYGTWL